MLQLLITAALCGLSLAEVSLDFQSVVYIPKTYNPQTFQYNIDAAEQIAVDPRRDTHIIYAAGKD